jgi:hypothetical protein
MSVVVRNYKDVHPPTIYEPDETLENRNIHYPDYLSSETFVISGPLGVEPKPWIRGRQFDNAAEAEEWVLYTYGEYYEHIKSAMPDRWAYRVKVGSHREQRLGVRGAMEEAVSSGTGKFRVE